MATSTRRLTRKDLRQPDWFQTTSEKALEIYAQHRNRVWIAAAGCVLFILTVLAWQAFKGRQDSQAAEAMNRALVLYQSGKHTEAAAEFQKVEEFRWSRYAAIAHLYEANSYLAVNDIDKGSAAAERFLLSTKPNSLYREIGLTNVAVIDERKGQFKKALERYSEAERIGGPFKGMAILGKARCSEQLGDIKTAIAAYRDYLKDYPESSVALQLADLEAKNGGAAPAQK